VISVLEINKIHNMDCIEGMKKLPNRSVDLVLTDPPYGVIGMEWDKHINWDELAKEIYRVLKVNGSIYIFGQFPMICEVYNAFSKIFSFKQDLVWYKNRGFSLANTIFTKYHENILFFVKGNESIVEKLAEEIKAKRKEKGWTVKDAQKAMLKILPDFKYYEHGGGGWLWFETGRCPTLKEYEILLSLLDVSDNYRILFERPVFNFEDIKLDGEPYTITRKAQKLYGKKSNLGEFQQINNGKRNPKTVLEYSIIQGGKEYVGHPTQKPIELLKYLLIASSRKSEVILDCFMGSGSTAVACQQIGRQYIGFELDSNYVKIAEQRLKQKSLLPLAEQQEGGNGVPPTPKECGYPA
jgi:site-specific DNA-methyltransferase (adenine-specific)